MMKKLNYSIDIHASKEEVWNTLWDDATYRQWTSAFQEGSHAVSDWKEGSKILFLGPNGEGMYSRIERKIPNELMIFKHLGVAKDGKEAPMTDETKKWSGATESYKLSQNGEHTTLKVDADSTEEHFEIFKEAFPKALQKLKTLAEKKHEMANT
jgi:hypothetical protein